MNIIALLIIKLIFKITHAGYLYFYIFGVMSMMHFEIAVMFLELMNQVSIHMKNFRHLILHNKDLKHTEDSLLM